jgi:hypothetical protein
LGKELGSFLQVPSFNPSFRGHNKVPVGKSEYSRASCGDFNSIRDNFVWDSTVFRGGKLGKLLRFSFVGNSGVLVEANRVAGDIL